MKNNFKKDELKKGENKSSKMVLEFLEKNNLHKKEFAQMIGVTLSYVYNLIDENIPFEVVFTGKGKPIKIRAWNKYQPWNDGEVQLLPSGQIDSYCGKGENLFEPDLNVYDACAELKRHYEFDFLKHSEELA